ncbi:cobalt-precorrin-5B C(1)-methyltransferase [Lachnospiraceae bacterium]|nr:cobalt-precorrin-5B C(1)-methyltransferase [Lachnospiraceae bacterium]
MVTPGNYGLEFLRKEYGIREDEAVKCSNYVGQTLDMAAEKGCRGMLLAGHIGKLIKVAGGIMNTHSGQADCRMELLAAAALRAGIDGTRARMLLECSTTDDAFGICTEEERVQIMGQVMKQAEKYLSYRVQGRMAAEILMFSNVYGILGKSSGADAFMDRYRSDKK